MSPIRLVKLVTFVLGVSLTSIAVQAAITHTTHNLNLRSGPDTTYPPISVIPAGAAIDVLNCGTSWCHVHWSSHLGYVNGSYLLTHATVVVAPLAHVHPYAHTAVVAHPTVVVVQRCRFLFC